MSTAQAFSEAPPEGKEVFVPTPERIRTAIEQVDGLDNHVEVKAELGDYNQERIAAMFKSAQGQQELAELLVSHQDVFQEAGVDINPEELQSQINVIAATLADMEKYDRLVSEAEGLTEEAGKAAENAEENPGMFKRALRAVGGFAKRHPIVTTVLAVGLAAAVTAAGVAGGFYVAANWTLLMSKIGLAAEGAAAGVGGAMEVVEPAADLLPGAGSHGVPGLPVSP